MTQLPKGTNLVGALHLIKPTLKFDNGASTGAFAAAGTGNGGDGGDWTPIPQLFASMSIGPKWTVGLGINAPAGIKTEYDAGWRGQITALKSDVKVININPSVAYEVNNSFSVGAGISYQHIEADLTSFVPAPPASLGPGAFVLKAKDNSWGFNLGVLFKPTNTSRIGMAYRSSVGHKVEGNATFPIAAGNSSAIADLTMPASFSLSAAGELNPRWEIMGDITWTQWSRFKQLTVLRSSGAAAPAGAVPGTLVAALPFNWSDTWRLSAGANFKPNPGGPWKFRFGVAYDPTPTNSVDRTARLPDEDRFWVAFGVQYQVSKQGKLDVGYAHEFIRDASINNVVPGVGTFNGKFNNSVDAISVQYSHTF